MSFWRGVAHLKRFLERDGGNRLYQNKFLFSMRWWATSRGLCRRVRGAGCNKMHSSLFSDWVWLTSQWFLERVGEAGCNKTFFSWEGVAHFKRVLGRGLKKQAVTKYMFFVARGEG